MTTITIEVTDEQARQLAQEAQRLNVTPEDFITRKVIEKLTEGMGPPDPDFQDPDFQEAMEYVFQKNSELYRRLA